MKIHQHQTGKVRNIFLITVILLVVIIGLSSLIFQDNSAISGNQAIAQEDLSDNGAQRNFVTALGRLEPESEVIDISGPTGTRLISLTVKEGDKVTFDQDLAHLDGYDQKLAARNRAEILLKEGRELHKSETVNGESAIEEAELRLNQIDTLSPLEIKTQEAVVSRIKGDLENAKRSLNRLSKLHEKSSASEQAVDDQNAAVLRFQEELAQEELNLARLRAAMDIDRLMAQQKLLGAQAALESAQIGTRLQSLQSDLALAEAELEQLTVRAPIDGVILKILTWPGEKIGDQPILKMGNIDQMYAVAEVYETDIRFIKSGMRATVTSPALKNPLVGTVEKMSPIIFKNDVIDIDPASRVDARVVEVRIKLDNSSEVSHLSNLQVHVNINLGGNQNKSTGFK